LGTEHGSREPHSSGKVVHYFQVVERRTLALERLRHLPRYTQLLRVRVRAVDRQLL
jgi:hypothetical protein